MISALMKTVTAVTPVYLQTVFVTDSADMLSVLIQQKNHTLLILHSDVPGCSSEG